MCIFRSNSPKLDTFLSNSSIFVSRNFRKQKVINISRRKNTSNLEVLFLAVHSTKNMSYNTTAMDFSSPYYKDAALIGLYFVLFMTHGLWVTYCVGCQSADHVKKKLDLHSSQRPTKKAVIVHTTALQTFGNTFLDPARHSFQQRRMPPHQQSTSRDETRNAIKSTPRLRIASLSIVV